ncbi:MAG: Gfo/Idh/MocA family oxidoreductase [Pseudomonadota bacterium]
MDSNKPKLRFFETSAGQRHVLAHDRYLYANAAPERRVGIIGCGTIGQEHMRVTRLLGRATVGGIFDTQPASMQVALDNDAGHEPVPVCWGSLDEAIADDSIDAFFVCTPNDTHLAVFEAVLASGKPVFCEKPMATTIDDAARMVKLVLDYGAHVQIGLQYRYKAPYAEARFEALDRQSIGAIKTISMCEYRPPFLDKVEQWNKFAVRSGGTLVEKCCHYFDLMNLFAGARPARVFASGGQAVNFLDLEYAGKRSDIDDHGFVIVEYHNGVRANFTLNMFSPGFSEELILCGSRGRLVAGERFDFLHDDRARSTLRVEMPEPYATRKTQVDYPHVIESSGHHGATFFEHAAFFDHLDGHQTHSATPEDGLTSVLVASAAQQSIQSGAPVSIDSLIEQHHLAALL